MSLISRYILRLATMAFVITLVSLTATIWITQALSKFDLITAQGQTLLIFLFMTVLVLPAFITVIAPVALFVATAHTLNRLNADSELVVLNSAGVSRWAVIAPFLLLGILVAGGVAVINNKVMPDSLSQLRKIITHVRTDVFTNIVQPGRFSVPERGLTFHIRDRDPDGTLRGLIVQDSRDEAQQLTYLAERGRIARSGEQTYLVMQDGTIHRRRGTPESTHVVTFDSYAVDLAMLDSDPSQTIYEPRERPTAYLLAPDPDDVMLKLKPGRFASELHERLASPLYPIVFVFIALACLGFARTTRQGRGLALLTAGVAALVVRLAGFGATSMAGASVLMTLLAYLIPLAAIAICAAIAFGLLRPDDVRAAAARWWNGATARLARPRRRPATG